MKFTSIFSVFQKLSFKLILFIFIIGIIPLSLSSYYIVQIFEESLIESTFEEVELLSDAQEGATLIYLDGLKKRTIDFSTDGLLKDFLLKVESEELEDGNQETLSLINKHLSRDKLSADENLLGIDILNLDGKIIASTDNDEIGRQIDQDDFWLKTMESERGEAIISDLSQFGEFHSKTGILAVSSYIFDYEIDRPLGVIVNYFNTGAFDEILIGEYQLRLGALTGLRSKKETLDIYLVNRDKIMISSSRFSGDVAIFNQLVDTVPIRGCLDNYEELVGIWDDYRGIPVIGSAMCLPYSNWTLMVEIDVEEIMEPIIMLERSISIGILMLLTLILIVGIFFSRSISVPIINLTKTAKDISRGRLDTKIDTISRKDEIGLLSNSFDKMANSLRSQEKEKYEFITAASHQLRTPISSSSMQLEVIKDEVTKLSGSQGVLEGINNVIDTNSKTSMIMNDLFKVMELGGEYKPTGLKDHNLKKLVQKVVDSLIEDIEKNKLSIDIKIPDSLKVKIDENRFKLVIINLIDNAVTYSNESGKIIIDAREENGQIYFSVEDFGIGIPQKDQIQIFDKFFRAKNTYEKKNVGTGLGLAIVKSIIKARGGEVDFKSSESKGSTFWIKIPKEFG